MKGIGQQSFLIIFDFDDTVVDSNTDVVIPTALGRGDLQRALLDEGKIQWTTLVDTLVAPFSSDEIAKAASDSVRVDPDMHSVFKYLREMQDKYSIPTSGQGMAQMPEGFEVGCVPNFLEVDLVSASNLLFIEASLQAHLPEVFGLLRQVHSNPYYELDVTGKWCAKGKAYYDAYTPAFSVNETDEAERDAAYNAQKPRRSRVSWYEPLGDICEGCLELSVQTMCKSKAVHRILSTSSLIDPTIIYVGDGRNDNCPVMSVLRPRDFVFVRRGFPLHKLLSNSAGGCCSVGLWSNGKELLRLFQTVMEHPAIRLPTMVRFRDVSDSEFRAVTLSRRLADIVQRIMSANKDYLSPSGVKRLEELMKSLQSNGMVPALPGQRVVPAWLRNYAFVAEHDRSPASPQDCADWVVVKEGQGTHDQRERVMPVPRWGQMPWLLGEILFQHMYWQLIMLKEEPAVPSSKVIMSGNGAIGTDKEKKQAGVVNLITPYTMHNPLFSQECKVAPTSGIISPGINSYQGLNTEFLVRSPLETQDGILVQAFSPNHAATSQKGMQTTKPGWEPVLPYTQVVDPLGDSLLYLEGSHAASAGCTTGEVGGVFADYRDIVSQDKEGLIKNFIKARIVPILGFEPWGASLEFVGILLRWMLWGNGLDLSVFTLEDLNNSHGKQNKDHTDGLDANESATAQEKLDKIRDAEAVMTKAKDDHIVGNDLESLSHYIKCILRRQQYQAPTEFSPSTDNGHDVQAVAAATIAAGEELPCQIDIVMDNVGVECISDLCFGLWFIQQAAANGLSAGTVVFHVKPHPYYISDVTPRDFDEMLLLLESFYNNSEKDATYSEEERKSIRSAVEPFVNRVRAAFTEGRFRIDADTAWTQPCEYRDLPPRLVNRYFFTQRVMEPLSTAGGPLDAETEPASIPASAIYRMNKAHITPRTALVIFKGDLNYRRVVGDRHWDRDDFATTLSLTDAAEKFQDTNVATAPSFSSIVSAYWPTHVVPLCCIRTIKSEGCIGVAEHVKAVLDEKHGTLRGVKASVEQNASGRTWCLTGKEGLILFAN